VADQAGHDLEGHEAEDQPERDGELARIRIGGGRMRVAVVARVRVPVGVAVHG
jgi:hypothetical protein